jgi:DNA replication ATP-dependent helicase Dna2
VIRGIVVGVSPEQTVSTRHGNREVVEVALRGTAEGPVEVTLWGKWTETAEYLEPGMELAVTDPEREERDGGIEYSTTGDSFVIVEPDFLVDVTDIREWVQCPRQYYLSKLGGTPLAEPVVTGTIVHEIFGDLLRGRDLDESVEDRVAESALDLGMLGHDPETVRQRVFDHASAIEGWLQQGTLTQEDEWRSEQLLISDRFGMKGRADAVRRGMPVELKTGKNTRREPRFHDKVQATCYALMLRERGVPVDTGVLLYTKNATLDRAETDGDLAAAKEFSIGHGLLAFVVRARNHLAAMEHDVTVPTGHEAEADCDRCFVQDTCQVVAGRLGQESKAGAIGRAVPEEERAYFEAFYEAIEAERRQVHDRYRALWEQTAEERADDDRALIGLEPDGREELDGGRWRLRARRPHDAVSKLREGGLVLASDGDPIEGHAELARIERLTGDEIVLTADEPVAVRRLDQYPSELSVDRMLTALHDAVLKGSERRKDLLLGRSEPAFEDVEETFIDNNDAQDRAVRRAVAAEDCALIHGPPGTGKTYTIARTIRALVERGERVLLAAFTNRAVDNALEALREQGFEDVVRVGTRSGVRDDMQDLRLTRYGEPAERAAELDDASVVAATTAGCGSRIMREQSFDVALVDEASQLTEPGTLAAINRAERFVLVGDHHQLPPVVRDEGTYGDEATVGGDLSRSLFERLIDRYPDAGVLLDRQYRMAQRIQAFSSREFYDGTVRPALPAIAGRSLADLDGVDPDRLPAELDDRVTFLDVEGDTGRRTDADEVKRIAELIDAYSHAGVSLDDIGVIAPYRAQVAAITKAVPDVVTIDTVDRFQGSSEEVIVVSFVATGDLEGPIFEDYRRVNVALTRAKRALVLVGDAQALATDDVYERMVSWATSA